MCFSNDILPIITGFIPILSQGLSKSFATTPQNVTVSQSGTAFFECRIKRSRPEAKITWSKEGKNTDLTLNPRFVVFPSGTLEIGGVMQSDAGNYICKATNKELRRSVTAKATLTVTSCKCKLYDLKLLCTSLC